VQEKLTDAFNLLRDVTKRLERLEDEMHISHDENGETKSDDEDQEPTP
jgi:hypothetical protein